MGFVRLFLGLVVREHAIKLWPYLRRRSPISQMPYSVHDHPQIGLSNPQPCGGKPATFSMCLNLQPECLCGKAYVVFKHKRMPIGEPRQLLLGLVLKDPLISLVDYRPNIVGHSCSGTTTTIEAAN